MGTGRLLVSAATLRRRRRRCRTSREHNGKSDSSWSSAGRPLGPRPSGPHSVESDPIHTYRLGRAVASLGSPRWPPSVVVGRRWPRRCCRRRRMHPRWQIAGPRRHITPMPWKVEGFPNSGSDRAGGCDSSQLLGQPALLHHSPASKADRAMSHESCSNPNETRHGWCDETCPLSRSGSQHGWLRLAKKNSYYSKSFPK